MFYAKNIRSQIALYGIKVNFTIRRRRIRRSEEEEEEGVPVYFYSNKINIFIL